MTTPVYQPAAAAPADFPGKTLGIVGLVLVLVGIVTAFVGTLAGLIISHVALSQSKRTGFTNTPATIGVIVGWILIGLGVIGTIVVIAVLGATLFGGVLAQCSTLGPGEHTLSNGLHLTCG